MTLRDYARQIGLEVGCSDSGCIWGSAGGMCTNGGCRCGVNEPRLEMRRFARVARHLADLLEK